MKFRMTPQRDTVIRKLRGGVKIVSEKTDHGQRLSLSDGTSIGETVLEGFMHHRLLIASGDGLFGDSQSYGLDEVALADALKPAKK